MKCTIRLSCRFRVERLSSAGVAHPPQPQTKVASGLDVGESGTSNQRVWESAMPRPYTSALEDCHHWQSSAPWERDVYSSQAPPRILESSVGATYTSRSCGAGFSEMSPGDKHFVPMTMYLGRNLTLINRKLTLAALTRQKSLSGSLRARPCCRQRAG